MSSFEDLLNGLSGKRSQFTVEEIEKARKQARKNGGSFLENLQGMTGRQMTSSSDFGSSQGHTLTFGDEAVSSASTSQHQSGNRSSVSGNPSDVSASRSNASGIRSAVSGNSSTSGTRSDVSASGADGIGSRSSVSGSHSDISGISSDAAALQAELQDLEDHAPTGTVQMPDTSNLEHFARELEQLNQNLFRDFGAGQNSEEMNTRADAESFDGVSEAVAATVFGQNQLLKKMTVAFKRPFILPEEAPHAKNSFYIYGPENTGRHLALQTMTQELYSRHILVSGEIKTMDLSLYTAPGRENIFLQDLYTALMSPAQVLLFENFDSCHVSYLNYLRDLVIKGECRLQDRYVLQKGQLVNVNSSFVSDAVGSFTAEGKYLAFMGNKGVDTLANIFGAPFVNALGDVCVSEALTKESYQKIAEVSWKKLAEKAEKQLSFLLTGDEEEIYTAAVAATEKNAGMAGMQAFFAQLLKSLATLKLEGTYPKETTVELKVSQGSLMAVIGEEQVNLLERLPGSYTGEVEAVKAELNNIVGLTEVKEYILSLEEYYQIQKRREEAGLKASDVSKHMIFTGNPGTGKTTIARILSRYLKAMGILSGGQLVEVSRADLVGRYVGHTAPLVNQVISSALGGVLFIDEAYSLYRGQEDQFGLEAIDTLVKGIEDHRDNLIVILAGYQKEMEVFLEANSGLKSRFPNFINFPDYTGEELLAITKLTVKSKGYRLDEAAEQNLLIYYNMVQAFHAAEAGNGRLVRNKVEEAILNQSRRLVAEPEADLSLIKPEDFELKLEETKEE